jgi:hypothetical protein
MINPSIRFICILLSLAFSSALVRAQVPQIINYQGRVAVAV